MIRNRSFITFLLGLLILTAVLPIPVSRALNAPVQAGNPRTGAARSCQDIISLAMEAVQSSCDNLGRNKACYGNAQVTVEPNSGAALKFDAVGDRAAIQDIRKLITAPLSIQKGTWGLSLLKLQANLPDTVPGQNVTFLVFGDTAIENTSGDMQAFYFSSALGTLTCNEVPRDGILVRSPNHVQVSFKANGIDITIASTILMRAARNQGMTVTLIEGHASVSTAQGSQTLQPGQAVTVPLGGPNGLEPVGAPSQPVSAQNDPAIPPLVGATDKVADPNAGLVTTIDSCVTAVQGNFVVIGGHTVNVGSDPALKDARVGDCFQISGVLKNNGTGLEFVPGKATPKGKAKAASAPQDNDHNYGNGNGNGNNGNGNGNGSNAGGNGGANGNGNNGNGNGGGNGGNNGNGTGNGGGDGSNAGGNGGGNGNGNGNGGGNGSNAGGNGGGNGNGNNGNGNGNGGGNGSNGNGNGNGNNK